MTVKHIIDQFLRSEWFSNWSAENVESGSYSRDTDRRDRFGRCSNAAESGADGSTHRERIQDMRDAFKDWLKYGRTHSTKRSAFAEYPYRLETAVMKHFDDLEEWHANNGSLDQEIG